MISKSAELGSLFEFIRNGMNIKQDKSGEGIPITRIETISEGEIDPLKVGYAGIEPNEAARWLLKPGDILFSHINSVKHVGKCALYDGSLSPLIHGMNLLNLRPNKDKLDSTYGKWLLRSPAFRAKLMPFVNRAVNQASVSIGNLSAIAVQVPAVSEQKRIAAILDQADSLRVLRQRAIDRLNSLGQAMFLEMFGDPRSNPKKYPIHRLGDVADVRDGTHDSPAYVDDGHPLLTSKNFTSGKLNIEGAKLISEDDYKNINRRSKVDIGDIVMPMIGTIGSPVVIEEEPHFAIKNVALIKFGDSDLSAWYVNAILSGPYLQHHVAAKGRGGTQQFISLGDLRSLEIPVPPRDEQTRFAEQLNSLKFSRHGYELASANLEKLFSSLQHRAFRGEL